MLDLLSQLVATPVPQLIHPREIFMALPSKDKQYQYPRDVQAEVWDRWFSIRDKRNTIIKMNTGSGKTIVGLLILQSCLNEGKGPAVYVVPDRYLVNQVCEEAKKLNIRAVSDRDDYFYSTNQAILVTTIHALVNGHSVFGMRATQNYPIGSILLDDVHACMGTISSQFSIKIPGNDLLYNQIVSIIKQDWMSYDSTSYVNIVESQDPSKIFLLPFWIWQQKSSDIYRLLKNRDTSDDKNTFIYFSLPLLEGDFQLCNCTITSNCIEITPPGIAISKIQSFEFAQRRIFMSATLADDSVFISTLGLNQADLTNIITPVYANDIGDRLLLFPSQLNSQIPDEDIRAKICELSQQYNTVVIVPSYARAHFWQPVCNILADSDHLTQTVASLKHQHVGLVVLVNRYDGIDLPDDACRILVIDGLPPLKSKYDQYVESINPTSQLLLREQIQRIEQGMGRGVRSSNDSCCVIFMGNQLSDILLRANGVSMFSVATQTQYALSKNLWDLLKRQSPSPTVEQIFELANYSLQQIGDWIGLSKSRLSQLKYNSTVVVNRTEVALRNAYEAAAQQRFPIATTALSQIINEEEDPRTKGYLLQICAQYANFYDQVRAQRILASARTLNHGTLLPIEGIQYNKIAFTSHQVNNIKQYLASISNDCNICTIHIHAILDRLIFSPDAHDFEHAFKELGEILGFVSSMPDLETHGAGPDNLWAIGNNTYLIFECKSGAQTDTISKDYCNQLSGSTNWFISEYGGEPKYNPIMVHPSTQLNALASPPQRMRIMDSDKLFTLKEQVKAFYCALFQNGNLFDDTQINQLLTSYRLRSSDIVNVYTMPPRQ